MNTSTQPEFEPTVRNNLALRSRQLMIALGATAAITLPGAAASSAATGEASPSSAESTNVTNQSVETPRSVGQVAITARQTTRPRRKVTPRKSKKPEWVPSLAGPRELGVAVSTRYMNEPSYMGHIKTSFDMLVPENEGKSREVIPTLGALNNPVFAPMDRVVDTARGNGQSVRYHSVVFGDQDPFWIKKIGYRCRDNFLGSKKPASRELSHILNTYTTRTANRYNGRVKDIDVINEPLEKNGQLEKNAWYECLGIEYIDTAFRASRAADSSAKLYLNEFDAELPGAKQDALFELVKGMQARGVPIDGVGLQTHVDLTFIDSIKEFEQTLKRFASLGLIVKITELDVALPKNASAADFQKQTKVYEAVVRACVKQAACGDVVVWGASDDKSWLTQNSPTLFEVKDSNYIAKPAYKIIRNLVK